jgi:hypothetical protein
MMVVKTNVMVVMLTLITWWHWWEWWYGGIWCGEIRVWQWWQYGDYDGGVGQLAAVALWDGCGGGDNMVVVFVNWWWKLFFCHSCFYWKMKYVLSISEILFLHFPLFSKTSSYWGFFFFFNKLFYLFMGFFLFNEKRKLEAAMQSDEP